VRTMSDVFWQALIGGVVSVLLAMIANRTAKVQKELAKNTAKTEEIAKTGEATHMLVNSARGDLLQLHATTARAKADITKDKADLRVADDAEKTLAEHKQRQAAVDANQDR
jgi:hypothetical protein